MLYISLCIFPSINLTIYLPGQDVKVVGQEVKRGGDVVVRSLATGLEGALHSF
jgi:hypothetical protein